MPVFVHASLHSIGGLASTIYEFHYVSCVFSPSGFVFPLFYKLWPLCWIKFSASGCSCKFAFKLEVLPQQFMSFTMFPAFFPPVVLSSLCFTSYGLCVG